MGFLRRLIFLVFCFGALHLLIGCGEDHPDLPALSVDHAYVYGEKVSFAAGGDSHRFRTTGWSEPEPAGAWTDGPAATLAFRLEPAEGPLRLAAKLSPNIKPPAVSSQLVNVYVRGQEIATWRVAGPDLFTAMIPQKLIARGGLVFVDLHITGAISPQELGSGGDPRRLGVQCSEITITKTGAAVTPAYTLGTLIGFGTGRGADRYQVSGWSKPEPEFTWTEGTSAALQLQLATPLERRLVLHARMRGISRSAQAASQPTDVFVNGEKVDHWEVMDSPAEFQAFIPPGVTNGTNSLLIEFKTPMAVSPSQLGGSGDTRVLGVCVFEMRITADS